MAEDQPQEKGLVSLGQRIVLPAVTAKEAIDSWHQYQALKKSIVEDSDIQSIGKEKFLKKSYWRKAAAFFNLSIETVQEDKELLPDAPGHWIYNFTVKAVAPNGREVMAVASCDAYEKAKMKDGSYQSYDYFKKTFGPATPNTLHNVRSTAYTRAFNRAVSDMIGGGEVSAEEVDKDRDDQDNVQLAPARKPAAKPEPKQDVDAVEGEIVESEVSESEEAEMYEMAEELGYTRKQMDGMIAKKFEGVTSILDLTKDQYTSVMHGLTEKLNAPAA